MKFDTKVEAEDTPEPNKEEFTTPIKYFYKCSSPKIKKNPQT